MAETQPNSDERGMDGAVARSPNRSEPARPEGKPATERPERQSAAADRPASRSARRRLLTRWGLFAVLPVILLAGAYWYVTGGEVMSTDDAYVNADKVGLSTDVSGIVQKVDVSENQHVNAGQVLYQLDPRQFQIALDSAKANLAQTSLTIESMKKDYGRMQSDINAEQAQVDLDQVNYNRYAALVKTDAVTKANYDQARFTLQSDQSKLSSLKGQAEVQLAKLGGNADIAVTDHPEYRQAKAQVDETQRELDHTVVKAPFAGIVTDVPAIAPGKYLQASTTAFYLVATDHVWVDANPKETELTYVRPGQPATVTVDTYPDRTWHGTVASISPAAAQEFQLLPAQNTSGNWVKVVQRVPMRVRVDTSGSQQPPLRAGMSVEVAVDTGHERGLPHFLASLFGETNRSS
ncbi:HlyD family secretion protein [Bradyrhizobium sp. ISRA463]|nr:HlyD family secretion protein [Bradyrhizobium sp. ISRA463]WGS17377.1 HlyD family secretion protein [Bradyrhizobium sp. ISRA463]